MTEREAWLWIAKDFRKPKYEPYLSKTCSESGYAGICGIINAMMRDVFISLRMCAIMKSKVGKYKPNVYGYKWPTTYKGARQRVAFCLKMARQLKRK